MQQLFAIANLTWKAAFRFRLFWVVGALLMLAAIALPMLLKDDGTARGFTQILLTYNLSVITGLLGFCTLWLACGTLAREIEDAQMQLVTVKPIPRWKIWVGKWLGIVLLDAALLAVSGASVYALLMWRAQTLPAEQQTVLRQEVLVSRGSLREPEPNYQMTVEQIFQRANKERPIPPAQRALERQQIREALKNRDQLLPPNTRRVWLLDFGLKHRSIQNEPLSIRTKFFAARTNATGTYLGLWQIGDPASDRLVRRAMSMAPDTFHEFGIPEGLLNADGILRVEFINRTDTTLIFPLEEGMEVLYREGGFGLNYARGLGIILAWMGLLAALGLAASSTLSFPVAAFVSLSLLLIVFSSGTLSTVVEEGTLGGVDHETGGRSRGLLDLLFLPLFRAILAVVNLVEAFSPIAALSVGRSIGWGDLGVAWLQVVLFLGGMLALVGIWAFNRRELAEAQSG